MPGPITEEEICKSVNNQKIQELARLHKPNHSYDINFDELDEHIEKCAPSLNNIAVSVVKALEA